MNYSFEEVALKQSQSLREYSLHNGEKSLTPFKDYLKETRNIKLNNPIKAKIKLAQLKLNENINDIVNTSACEEPYIKEELIGLKLLQKNHRNKLTGELQYIIDQNIKKYEKKESFQDALIDSHRNRSLSPLKLYLEGKQKTKKTNI